MVDPRPIRPRPSDPAFAAITPVLVMWGRAPSAETFRAARGIPADAALYRISDDTLDWLDAHPWVGGQVEAIQAGGIPVGSVTTATTGAARAA